jgi:hypothetical protein
MFAAATPATILVSVGARLGESMDRDTAEDIKRHLELVAESLRGEIRLVDEKGDQRSWKLEDRLRAEMQDVKRHFDVVGEGLRSDIRLVAEGVAGLDEKFTLEFQRVREEIGEQIGEVKSLLRASYADLDRRFQALERKPS